jgi:alkylhydroperoxidase/carboxymuconolactone decarboxylase family protein YurZ
METRKKTKTELAKAPAIVERLDPEYFQRVKALFHHSHFAREGARLPEKFKQMLVMAVAAASHQREGIQIHMRRALEAGASQEEILEALEAIAIPSGFPALWYGALVLEEEMAAREEGKTGEEGLFPWNK